MLGGVESLQSWPLSRPHRETRGKSVDGQKMAGSQDSAFFSSKSLLPHKIENLDSTIRQTMTKVVLVATSATSLQGHDTGLWIEELAAPYYEVSEL